MTQYILEHPKELINHINSITCVDSTHYFSQLVRIKSIVPKQTNILKRYTLLPSVLIEIVDSYAEDNTESIITQVQRNIIYAPNIQNKCASQNVHIHFWFYVPTNSSTFWFMICINFTPRQCNDQNKCKTCNESYNSTLYIVHTDNNVLERKVSGHKMNDTNYHYQRILAKTLKKPNKYFGAYENFNDTIRHVMACHDYVMPPCHLFFNQYSSNMQQFHNIINNNSKRKNQIMVEDCKYYKKTDCYNHITVTSCETNSVMYIVKDKETLTKIISISKLLYDFINNQMKNICDDNIKVQELIASYDNKY